MFKSDANDSPNGNCAFPVPPAPANAPGIARDAGPRRPRVTALTAPEQLLLLALRKRGEGDHARAMLRNVLQVACGLRHLEQALAAFEDVFQAFVRHGGGTFAPLSAQTPTVQELVVLDLIAAAQRGYDHQIAALVNQVSLPIYRGALVCAVKVLAATLQERGHRLPSARVPRQGKESLRLSPLR